MKRPGSFLADLRCRPRLLISRSPWGSLVPRTLCPVPPRWVYGQRSSEPAELTELPVPRKLCSARRSRAMSAEGIFRYGLEVRALSISRLGSDSRFRRSASVLDKGARRPYLPVQGFIAAYESRYPQPGSQEVSAPPRDFRASLFAPSMPCRLTVRPEPLNLEKEVRLLPRQPDIKPEVTP